MKKKGIIKAFKEKSKDVRHDEKFDALPKDVQEKLLTAENIIATAKLENYNL